jgi:hypothetical protein
MALVQRKVTAASRQVHVRRSQVRSRRVPDPIPSEEALKRIIERLLDALSSEYLSDRLRPIWKDAKRAVGREE